MKYFFNGTTKRLAVIFIRKKIYSKKTKINNRGRGPQLQGPRNSEKKKQLKKKNSKENTA
jgi:hypothetical protein